jgi:predicted flap endonuclease-1-like 5' DNA nuclease
MTTVIIALLSFAIAFVAGGLLSKVYFTAHDARVDDDDDDADDTESAAHDPAQATNNGAAIGRDQHYAMLKAQRSRYRKRMLAMHNLVCRHEAAQEQIREKLHRIQQTQSAKAKAAAEAKAQIEALRTALSERAQEIEVLRGELAEPTAPADQPNLGAQDEMSLMRIERDELKARIKRLETDATGIPSEDKDDENLARIAANLRADMGALREKLATRDRQVHEQGMQLEDSQAQVRELEGRLDELKVRVSPLTKKLRQQRDVIRGMRAPDSEPADEPIQEGKNPLDELIDDLKKIRGIGPALERRLNRQGIHRYDQVAEMTEEQLASVAEQIAVAPALALRDRWIEQARDLAEQRAPN